MELGTRALFVPIPKFMEKPMKIQKKKVENTRKGNSVKRGKRNTDPAASLYI